MAGACNLKNYGCRTLLGNWYEERIALNKHFGEGTLKTRDLDYEKHIKPHQESPKWEMDWPAIKTSQYQDDTAQWRLDERDAIKRRINTANRRRRLQGTAVIAEEGNPGSTITAQFLTHQFQDPNKVRMKTTYQKAFGRPETAMVRSRGLGYNTSAIPKSNSPRRGITESTWSPGWKNEE